jgi:TonB family protein
MEVDADSAGAAGGNDPDGEVYYDEAADLGQNEEQETVVYSPPPEVTGPLSREIIRRVVRQHRREIKYCYEKELQSNPELAGRVTVNFTITPSGDVVSALVKESSLGNTAVEQCMQNKIRHWTFPGTEQPGMVQVNYPFNFSAE